MATKAKAKTTTTTTEDKRVIVEINGAPRMLLNERGDVVVVQKTPVTPYFPGNVRGMRPEAAARALADGEVELHVLSVVDPVDAEDDTASDADASPASPAPSSAS